MARVLILSRGFPDDLTSGLHLRVHHLCRELARTHTCFLANFSATVPDAEAVSVSPFEDAALLPPRPTAHRSRRRHLRLSNGRLLQQSVPAYFGRCVAEVRRLTDQWRIDAAVSFAPAMAEVTRAVGLPRVLDVPDSLTLTTERMLASRGSEMSLAERLRLRLELTRRMAGERDLLRTFDATMTVSPSDQRRLMALSGLGQDRIVVLPNGVAEDALAVGERPRDPRRAVVFWGNLEFPPNWTAVRFFHERVFLPHLADQSVDWYIVGLGAGEAIRKMAEHPRIHLAGFQEHLFEFIADKGVMINPMVEGSGIKNKVLEAFAVGLPVVTTRLGVDAIPVANGRECLIADEPRAFADAVLAMLDQDEQRRAICAAARAHVEAHFTWELVGQQFGRLVNDVLKRAQPAKHVG